MVHAGRLKNAFRKSLLLLVLLLILWNTTSFLTPYLWPSSFSTEEDGRMITQEFEDSRDDNYLKYQVHDDLVYTLQGSEIVVYNDNLENEHSLNIGDHVDIYRPNDIYPQLLSVDDEGIFVSFVREEGDFLNLEVGLFSEDGLERSWLVEELEKDTILSDGEINYMESYLHINTATGNRLLSYSIVEAGRQIGGTTFAVELCISKIVLLEDDGLTQLRDNTDNSCFFAFQPESFIYQNDLYISVAKHETSQQDLFYKYDEDSMSLTLTTLVRDRMRTVSDKHDALRFKGFFVANDMFLTLWATEDPAIIFDSTDAKSRHIVIQVFNGTDLLASLNTTNYLLKESNLDYDSFSNSTKYLSSFPTNTNNIGLTSTSLGANVVNVSPRNILIPVEFGLYRETKGVQIQSLIDFRPQSNEMEVLTTLENSEDEGVYHHNRKVDLLGKNTLVFYGEMNDDGLSSVFISTASLKPHNIPAFFVSQPVWSKSLIPSLLLVLLVISVNYIRADLSFIRENSDLYPDNQEVN